MLTSLSQLGSGGSGIPDKLPAALKELQGLNITQLVGAASSTKINLAAIRQEDTILLVQSYATGANPVDRTSATTIVDCRATGTLTFASAVAGDTFTIAGRTYTLKAAGTANALNREINLGASDTATAAAVAAYVNQWDPRVICSPALGVVTVTAFAEGTGGNAFTLVGGTRITASGATLSGGTTTGGIKISADTSSNAVVVYWFNKQ